MTRNKLFLLIVVGLLHFNMYGQQRMGRPVDERMHAIESRRVAHITRLLSLTPAEARLFWPVYDEFTSKQEELNRKHLEWSQQLSSIDSMTDEEAEMIAEREIQRLEELAALRRSYHEKFKEALPIRKIAILYEAERTFNRMLLRESQQRFRGGVGRP